MQNETLSLEVITAKGEYESHVMEESTELNSTLIDWERSSERIQEDIERTNDVIRVKIASIHGWPEYKTEMKVKCKNVFGAKICTKVPVAYRRHCTKEVFVMVSLPAAIPDAVRNAVNQCTIRAAAIAVAAAVAGGVSAALPVFSTAFTDCIQSSAGEYAARIKFKLDDETKCGNWTPY